MQQRGGRLNVVQELAVFVIGVERRDRVTESIADR